MPNWIVCRYTAACVEQNACLHMSSLVTFPLVTLRLGSLLLLLSALSGCGALWDLIDPPPPDHRADIGFYIAQQAQAAGLVMHKGADDVVMYLEKEPVVLGTEIRDAIPMVDAALQYFVAVRLKDKGASQLARATTQAVGRQLTLMVGDRFLGGALIDAPIEQGVFALPMQDQAAAFALAQLLNPPPY
jgi:hypothetical protein